MNEKLQKLIFKAKEICPEASDEVIKDAILGYLMKSPSISNSTASKVTPKKFVTPSESSSKKQKTPSIVSKKAKDGLPPNTSIDIMGDTGRRSRSDQLEGYTHTKNQGKTQTQ